MQKLFIYGTLQEQTIQLQVIGRFIQGDPDVLEGFTLSSLTQEGQTYPLVVPEPESQVPGYVITISETELEKIDFYEGPEYQRNLIGLQSGTRAWVYVAAESTLQVQ